MTRLIAAAAVLLIVVAPEMPAQGYASRYDPGVFEGVVDRRFREGWWRHQPPGDWYTVAGYAAVSDCALVGRVVLMRPVGATAWERVLVADCAGNDGTPDWMRENAILTELDYGLFMRWSDSYGVPLAIEMRPDGRRFVPRLMAV